MRSTALYQAAILKRFLWRLGVSPRGADQDTQLVEAAERAMVSAKIPIDDFFHSHRGGRIPGTAHTLTPEYTALNDILSLYRNAIAAKAGYWQQPEICSMHIDEVEAIWAAIAEDNNWEPLSAKINAIRQMAAAHIW
jgi:serine/tyrosine/threonine adenylyltransferase